MNAEAFGVRSLKGQVAQMFLGNFQHNLDDKGRLMIPARFRDLLAGGAYITQGFDKCLMVMSEAYFKQVYERIEAMNLADPTARLLRRLILSNAYPVEADKVGRILVPQNLRAFLGIENGELTVAGQGEYFEVWTPALWNEQMAELQNIEANNARFSTLDLSKSKTS
ncbi:MAG: division/cell wall cluster transcriptional repressor MraZ [Anaerolineales bacterium]|nr:division/cell wall cluster transcriptional repressor MraZ [Anaerolineales bacterium]